MKVSNAVIMFLASFFRHLDRVYIERLKLYYERGSRDLVA